MVSLLEEILLSVRNVQKTYKSNGVRALDGVSLDIYAGEVNVLLGENAAGKTTLMKIIAGIERADGGKMFINGRDYSPANPTEAIRTGIGLVSQKLKVIPQLTIAENLLLGMDISGFGRKQSRKSIEEAIQKFGMGIEPHVRVEDLSVVQRQKVEILRVLIRSPELIVFDEPTAILPDCDRKELMDIIARLKESGKTVIFITHKLPEAYRIADRISIMAKGRITGTFRKGEVTEGMLRTLVAGEDLAIAGFRDRKSTDTGEVLRVESLQVEGRYRGLMAVKNVSFVSRADEILVITGISGNGQEELLESLFGMRRVLSGSVHLYDTDITGWTPADLRKIGVAALIGDRDTIASCAGLSIMDNVVLNRVRERFFLKERPLRTWTRELLSSYGVEYSSLDDLAGTLSGGNLQKTILAREISGNPHLILLSEPTRGLDVKHAEMVHRTLLSLKQNLSIVLFTGDLDEAISIADRILIMYDGEIVVDLPNTGEIGRSMLNRYLQGTAEVKNK